MSQTLTFTKVFTAEGSSTKGPWTRWDFRTADGDRYSTFDERVANQILLNQPLEVEVAVSAGRNGHTNKTISAVLGSAVTNSPGDSPTEPSQPATQNPYSGNGAPGDARGKTKAIYAAQMGVALFNSLPEDEQTFEAATQIMDKLVDYAFES